MRAALLVAAAVAAATVAAPQSVSAYYLPGTYPREFYKGDPVQIEVNSLVSDETELPYDYYSLPFCKPPEGVRAPRGANPGLLLSGARIHNSPYNLTTLVEEKTRRACPGSGFADPLTDESASALAARVDARYRVRLILDNLPVTTYDLEAGDDSVLPGVELGFVDADGGRYINNHLMFKVLVHRQTAALLRRKRAAAADAALAAVEAGVRRLLADAGDERADDDSFMIVGFEVLACSIARSPGDPITDTPCADGGGAMPPPQLVAPGARVAYTYDVFWEESAITWATRWDAYLRAPGGAGSVHWLSILNSLAVVLVTSSLVAWIMARTVRRDLARYEAVLGGEGDKDGGDDGGWKAVAGDAFRPPPGAATLAARVGAGVQILAATAATLAAAAAGFLSPASRGALVTGLLAAYIALAAAAGYAGVRVWARMQRGAAGWPAVAWRAAAHYPALALAVLAALNVLLARSGSSGAIPAAAFFSVAALYLAVSIPLAFAGGAAAARAPPPDPPTRTNQIPRRVPPARWASSGPALFAAAGLLPFGTLLVELHFAMASLWRGYFYYVFGFAAAIAVLVVLLVAQVSVVTTYVQLCGEDYRWWWPSFARGGAVAAYVALYALAFLFSTLHALADTTSVVLYLAYAGLALWGLYLACGTVGFLASAAFVRAIFAAIKSE